MNVKTILTECESSGVSVRPLQEGKLYVDPIGKLSDELREKLVANKPEIIEYLITKKHLHVHRVLVKLKDLKIYRDGDSISWRNEPSLEQRELLTNYSRDLLEALTPRALTTREAGYLALWLDDIGETEKIERDRVFNQANRSPTDRTALLWMADGSPEM